MTHTDEKFEAKLMVQGVGNYVPHVDGDKLVVLFPDQETAEVRGIRAFNGEKICRHHAVIQFSLRNLDSNLGGVDLPDQWTSVDFSKHWISLATDSEVEFQMDRQAHRGFPGVPNLEKVFAEADLAGYAAVDPRAIPGTHFSPALLRGGLYLDRGLPSPGGDFKGQFTFFDGGLDSQRRMSAEGFFANVVEFELGEVSHFSLRLVSFEGGQERTIPLRPADNQDYLEVWVRHFCDLEKPDPEREEPEPEEPDADFALTYALCRDLESLLFTRGHLLPFPRVSSSWASGAPIGGRPNKCMGAENSAASFSSV